MPPTAVPVRTRRIIALEERRDAIARELERLDDLVVERGQDLDDVEREQYEANETELEQITGELARLIAREEAIAASHALGTRLHGARPDLHVHSAGGDLERGAVDFREFFGNVLRFKLNGDPEAAQYIARSNEEQREIHRATATGNLPGIVIPQYEQAVTVPVEAGRRFVNTLNRRNVTSEVVHVPTVDDELEPEFQSAQNNAFDDVSYATTDATYTTRTIGAYADVSVQAIDFSSIDPQSILNELQRGYNRKVEQQTLRGTVDNATNLLGIANTSGVPTVDGSGIVDGADLWEAIGAAAADIDDAQTSDDVIHVALSRRSWNAIKHTMTAEHPLLNIGFGQQIGSSAGSGGVYDVGDYRFVVTNNVKDANGTDRAVLYIPERVWFYEGNGGRLLTITDVISQAYTGTVRVVARNYVNFPGVRPDPTAAAVITGVDLLPVTGS